MPYMRSLQAVPLYLQRIKCIRRYIYNNMAKNQLTSFKFIISCAGLTSFFLKMLIVWWTLELQKKNCECSASWKRDYVRYSCSLSLILDILFLFAKPKLSRWASLLLLAFLLSTYGVLLDYARDLRRNEQDCPCSDDWGRTVAFVWPIAVFSFPLAFILWLMFMIYVLNWYPSY